MRFCRTVVPAAPRSRADRGDAGPLRHARSGGNELGAGAAALLHAYAQSCRGAEGVPDAGNVKAAMARTWPAQAKGQRCRCPFAFGNCSLAQRAALLPGSPDCAFLASSAALRAASAAARAASAALAAVAAAFS